MSTEVHKNLDLTAIEEEMEHLMSAWKEAWLPHSRPEARGPARPTHSENDFSPEGWRVYQAEQQLYQNIIEYCGTVFLLADQVQAKRLLESIASAFERFDIILREYYQKYILNDILLWVHARAAVREEMTASHLIESTRGAIARGIQGGLDLTFGLPSAT